MVPSCGFSIPWYAFLYPFTRALYMLAGEKSPLTIRLVPGCKIVGAATLNDLVLDAGATMWF